MKRIQIQDSNEPFMGYWSEALADHIPVTSDPRKNAKNVLKFALDQIYGQLGEHEIRDLVELLKLARRLSGLHWLSADMLMKVVEADNSIEWDGEFDLKSALIEKLEAK